MKEIETLVEEKKKDSSDMAKMITPQEGRFRLPSCPTDSSPPDPRSADSGGGFCPAGVPQLPAGVTLSLTGQQLNGSGRVLLDRVISADQCRQLQRLSDVSPRPERSEPRPELR